MDEVRRLQITRPSPDNGRADWGPGREGPEWLGPVVVWMGLPLGVAPVVGLKQAKRVRPVDRVALAVDHLLDGFIPSETRLRHQE